jgi:hypothetical protein
MPPIDIQNSSTGGVPTTTFNHAYVSSHFSSHLFACKYLTVSVLGGSDSVVDVTCSTLSTPDNITPVRICAGLSSGRDYDVCLSQYLHIGSKQPPAVGCRHTRVRCSCSSATARKAERQRDAQIGWTPVDWGVIA